MPTLEEYRIVQSFIDVVRDIYKIEQPDINELIREWEKRYTTESESTRDVSAPPSTPVTITPDVPTHPHVRIDEFPTIIDESVVIATATTPPPPVQPTNLTEKELLSLKKEQLKELCKAQKLAITGTKPVLIARLLGKDIASLPSKPKRTSKSTTPSIIEKLEAKRTTITIHRNLRGHYVDTENRFVYDPTTTVVIGKEDDTGTLVPLTAEDVEECKRLGIECKFSDNLQ